MSEESKTIETEDEVWRSIQNLSKYEISNRGNVRFTDTKQLRKQGLNSYGYCVLRVAYDDGTRKTIAVHILVALAFLGERPPGHDVNHINGIKIDNRVENLEYVTRSENILHAYRTGLNTYVRPIRIIETGEIFNSINECARAINGDPENIRQCAEGRFGRSKCCGYHFEFLEISDNKHLPKKIRIVETGEEFDSARECERAIEGNHRAIVKAAESGKTYNDLHFEIIEEKTPPKKPNKTDPNQILFDFQLDAMNRMFSGCILNGGTGSGKSLTSLFYYMKSQGGWIDKNGYTPMKNPKDLYIITTAKKRNDMEWEEELSKILLSTKPENNKMYTNKIVIDSWQNIKKYADVKGSFIIFDEDKGAWVKAFLKMAKNNEFIILSASPGDQWQDYIPIFVANGFYRNRTEFNSKHVVFARYTKYPKIEKYMDDRRLIRLRDKILIDMDFERHTVPHHEDIWCGFDRELYRSTMRNRWDPYKNTPIEQASGLCYTLRKIVNTDETRVTALLEILDKTPKAIIFYSFDYELDLLRHLFWDVDGVEGNPLSEYEFAEYNGHVHQEIPVHADKWVYVVNYNAGAEGFNCIETDTIIFFSQTYSYKTLLQAEGRIARLNSPFTDLYYYHLKSRSGIDLAISKALQQKKRFNERKFAKWD